MNQENLTQKTLVFFFLNDGFKCFLSAHMKYDSLNQRSMKEI